MGDLTRNESLRAGAQAQPQEQQRGKENPERATPATQTGNKYTVRAPATVGPARFTVRTAGGLRPLELLKSAEEKEIYSERKQTKRKEQAKRRYMHMHAHTCIYAYMHIYI